ncbi:hypothetical protein SASPL_127686 [Salvia splendens]|uniref:S-locus glycoprotein domain-containing protein n=1 Tax=Salvia splendens TaxID=180675 RepID=A0A8X8X9Z1_SALSN|nr:hypothetical protein SASPL_127686 [Salvia splendens]
MDAANVVDSFLCVDTSHLYSKVECLSVEEDLQFQNCRVNDCSLQVRARHIRADFGDAACLLDRCGDARTIPPSAPDDVVTDSLFVNAHSEVVTHGSDPHLALGVEGCFLDLMHSKTMEASLCGDSDWSRASLQFGANNGVHVFDPGAFEPGDSSVGENSSRLRHVHSSCEDADRSKDVSKARNIATIMAFEYEQPSIVLVMGVDVEFQLWNCAVKLVTAEQMSWDVTWLATSNECDVYGTCIPFWGCDIRASTICSRGRAFELVDKGENDPRYKWLYETSGTQGEEFIRLLFIKIAWIAVRKRFSGVGIGIHIGLISSTFDTKIKEVCAMISAADGDEVFEQMAYILLYGPHNTLWFTDFILALQSSTGFASLVASQLLPTFEFGQGDATILPHGKEGNGSETNGDSKHLQTTISFVPDFTERCQDVILGGENGAGEADKGSSLTSGNNSVADGDEGLFADENHRFAFWQLLFLCIWLDPSDVLKRKKARVFLVLLHTAIVDHLKEVENNVIMEDGFRSEEESSWIDVVANLGGEIHATSRELGDHGENDLSLDFGRVEEWVGVRSLETAGWGVARQTAAVEEQYVAISLTQHINSPIYSLDEPNNGVINSHLVCFSSAWRNRCVLGLTCAIVGLDGGDFAVVGEQDRAMAVDMRSSVMAPRWSDRRACLPWRINSLETIVPENLPRPSARRRWEATGFSETAPPVRAAVKSGAKGCFSM